MEFTPQFVLTAIIAAVGGLGSYFGLKYKLDSALAKLDAVHERLDEFEEKYHRLDKAVDLHHAQLVDLRAFKHKEGDTMNAFKMAKELLAEERADRAR